MRLEEEGFKLKLEKCGFMQPAVEYLGHHISAEGIRPSKEKVHAIVNAPPPQNISQLRSFLGLVNHYGKFLPQLANRLTPLYKRLQKDSQWK